MKIVSHVQGEKILQELSKMKSVSNRWDYYWEEQYRSRLIASVFGLPFILLSGVFFIFIIIAIYHLLLDVCSYIKNVLVGKDVKTV